MRDTRIANLGGGVYDDWTAPVEVWTEGDHRICFG